MKAIGHVVEGASAYEAGRFTRRVMQTNERNARNDGAAEASRIRDAARIAIGRQAASFGSSGFRDFSGSALDALRESSVEAELDIMTARRQAEARAQGFRVQGQSAYAQGYNAMTAGMINGAAALVDSSTSYAGG